jgi:hypothetical protein
VSRAILRAARLDLERKALGQEYERWRTTQHSTLYSKTIKGSVSQEVLDNRAAELKRKQTSSEQRFSDVIDTLTGHPETAQAVDLTPILEDAKRYTSEAREWIEFSRATFLATSVPGPKPVPPPPQLSDPDVDMEAGECSAVDSDGGRDLLRMDGNPWVTACHSRLETIAAKLTELEDNMSSASPNLAALIERAILARTVREEGETAETDGTPDVSERTGRVELLETQQHALSAQIRETAKEAREITAGATATQTELMKWTAKLQQLEARDREVRNMLPSTAQY